MLPNISGSSTSKDDNSLSPPLPADGSSLPRRKSILGLFNLGKEEDEDTLPGDIAGGVTILSLQSNVLQQQGARNKDQRFYELRRGSLLGKWNK